MLKMAEGKNQYASLTLICIRGTGFVSHTDTTIVGK